MATLISSGQSFDQTVADFVMRRWTTADGLPHNWISAIRQASRPCEGKDERDRSHETR